MKKGPTSVFTPIRGISLLGHKVNDPSPQITQQVMKAAIDTATGFASPPYKFMSTLNFFKLVSLTNDKNANKLYERIKSDPTQLHLRSANMKGRDGLTPLHYAASIGNLSAVLTILDAADKDEMSILPWLLDMQGRTPMHVACEGSHSKVVEALFKVMANVEEPTGVNAPTDLAGFTPSAWNAREQSKKSAKGQLKDDEKVRRACIKELM